MAERLAYLEAVVGADVTQFRKGMRDIRNEVGFLSETVRGLTGLGRSLTFAFTTPVLALGTAAVNVASDFEASMYNINAIAGLTGDELDALGQRTLEFGARTRAGANAASDALYTVFSAGLTNVEDAFSAMEVATYTAEAGLANITTTTETLIAVMLSYGDTSEEAAWRTSNAITQMVAIGVGSMEEFSTSLSSVIPTASAAGMSFEELAADMAYLTQRGLSASRAGVSLNAAIEQMVNPTQAMKAAFAELGARGLPDLIEQFGGVNGAITALVKTADGDLTNLYEMFNSRQARRAIGLFATDLEGWNTAIEDFNANVEGATMRAWEEQMSSFSASWDLLTSAVEGAGIAIGQTLFPVLQPIVDIITELVLLITDTNPELLSMATAFTVVAAVIPPLLWLIGSLITPFGVLVGAVTALGIAFAEDFMGIATSIKNAVSDATVHLQPLIDIINDIKEVVDSAFADAPLDTFFPMDSATLGDPYDYITVTEPTSLWDIYEKEGYSGYFSWNEFMERAIEGGWNGEAITPASNISIDLTGTELEPVGEPTLTEDFINATSDVKPRTKMEVIFEVVGNFMPTIQTELARIWNIFRNWLDLKGSEFINGVRSWFTVGAGTNLYTAFTQLLTGDFEGAINTVMPNMGTTLANAIGSWDLGQAFPRISASLYALFINIGDWLLSTGVPMLAQSAGFLAGRLGVMLYNAVQTAVGWFTSGAAGETASNIGQYVEDGIVDPFTTGFEQATAGTEFSGFLTDFQTMMTDLGDDLAEIADILDLDVTWDVLVEIGDALKYFFDQISEADTTGLSMASFIVIAAIINLVNTMGNSFANVVRSLGDTIAWFMESMSSAAEGDWLMAIAQLGGAFVNLAFALLQIPAGIFDWFLNGLDQLVGYDMGSVSDWLEDMRQTIMGVEEEFDATVPVTINPQFNWSDGSLEYGTMADELLLETGVTANLQVAGITLDMGRGFNTGKLMGLNMPEQITWDGKIPDIVTSVNDLRFSIDADERTLGDALYLALLEGMDVADANAFTAMMNYEPVVSISGVTYELTDTGYVVLETPDVVTTNSDLNATTTGAVTVTPEGTVELDTSTAITVPRVNLTAASTAFTEDFASGDDAQTIINDQLLPLQEAWNTMFAEDGDMAISFATFSSNVSAGWIAIDTAISDTATTMNEDLATAITDFDSNKETLVAAMEVVELAANAAKEEVNGLKGAIEGLLNLEGSVSVDVTVTGSGNIDGSHKTGLATVPYDGYIAELHKGEMVLTAKEANEYKSGSIPSEIATASMSSGGSGDTYTEVNLKGNLSVDDIIREFKRRGITLK